MVYDVIIVGGGPAGLLAGAQLEGRKALLLEGQEKIGKKLLMSGKGQCNFTHRGKAEAFLGRYGNKKQFVKKALFHLTNEDTRKFFSKQKVETFYREDGKAFPKSLQAKDIVKALKGAAVSAGVEILCGKKVKKIQFTDKIFQVTTEKGWYFGHSVILATGGKTYPLTGSDGSGYDFAAAFGHTVVELRPALASIFSLDESIKYLAGTSLKNCYVGIWREGKKIKETTGDVLFTHRGISGPAILDNSRYMKKNDRVALNLLPFHITEETVETALKMGKSKQVKTVLSSFLSQKLVQWILLRCNIVKDLSCAHLTKEKRKKLLKEMVCTQICVDSIGEKNTGMVTAGGISTKEVLASSMASKCQKGLFLAGEILDVDGDTGGFNIQWAMSSGYMAGQSARNFTQNKTNFKGEPKQ